MRRAIVLGALIAVGTLSLTVAAYQGQGQRRSSLRRSRHSRDEQDHRQPVHHRVVAARG